MSAIFLFLICVQSNTTLAKLGMRVDDKIRIAAAITISNNYGESIWEGYTKTPFTVLLVTDDYEYLIHHDQPSDDFVHYEYDSILQSDVYYRKSMFDKHFLATFPAVNGRNCIVVGTPENTGKNSSEWILTLLHEHFHQYVNSSPNYFKDVENLNLSKGDTSGMWMLNYLFPYQNERTNTAYNDYILDLSEVTKNLTDFEISDKKYVRYLKSRKKFQKTISKDDLAYFSFQLWQEGIARYTEWKFLELLENYEPSIELTQINDYIPFYNIKTEFLINEVQNLKKNQLETEQRICFYSVGLAEGLLLDTLNPDWKNKYLKDKFFLENYIENN